MNMSRNLCKPSQQRDNTHLFEFECHRRNTLSQSRQVVLIAPARLLDQAVFSQAFQKTRDLPLVFAGKIRSQVGVAETANAELAAQKRAKELCVVAVEEIEPRPTTPGVPDRTRDFIEIFLAGARVIDRGQ